ncbi:hypothetical protein E1B28_010636 [Marasmius oreades]|uniref:Uncharacterized protein n=1 Tax=Marasmius oreades TaxID=181124 RepID=A0A9P7RZ17_9AGAR|nr:uncharacterized protein E1B28_010636 [Marasmius oreades]KAG7091618.1 hypothetical protein E1B28_010636 [Marasmius oreades]
MLSMWEDQQPIDGNLFRSNPFFALETLEYNDNSSKKSCGGCGRNLSQNSFPAGSWDRQRENRFCHICDLIPTWQRREQFFADLKMKKKEEQEKKRAEAERSKKGKGKERAEGETLEQTKTVVDEKPKEGDDLKSGPSGSTPQDKGVSRSSGGRRRPVPNTAGRGDPSGKRPTPTQQPRIATVSNTTEKGGEVAEDGRKGITRNLRGNTARGNPPNATRAVPTVRTTTNHSEHGAVGTQDGTRRDHRGVRGGTGYVRGQGRRAGGTARGSKTTSQAPEQHVPSGSLTTETPTSHPQRKSAWARGPPSRTGRGGRGGESGDRGSA